MQGIWDWLIGEAGAGWIVGLAGLCLVVYGWLRRERAPRVIVQEVKRTKLLDIHPSQRESLKVFHTDEDEKLTAIEDLEQKDIVIYNDGSADIVEPVALRLQFNQPGSKPDQFPGFWRWVFDDPAYSWEPVRVEGEDTSVGVRVQLPYLNSYAVHHHYVRGYLISDRGLAVQLLDRVGKGWSAQFVALERIGRLEQSAVRAVKWLGRALALLSMLILVGSMGLSMRDARGRAGLNPTSENIQAAVAEYQESLETRQALREAGGARWIISWSLQQSGIAWLLCGLSVYVVGVLLMSACGRIGGIVSRRYVGARPASEFERLQSQQAPGGT